MESEVFAQEQFMQSPLVTWVRTFVPNDGATQLDYSELLDGVFLNDIMSEINPKASLKSVRGGVTLDLGQRVQNLNLLIRQIRTYYLENLRQVLLMTPPNLLVLGKSPHSEQGLEEMNKLLLLLLGCAVQCERKEEYIERIQTLDFDTKAAIAAHIQEVTHSEDSVLDLHWLEAGGLRLDDPTAASSQSVIRYLTLLTEQRDAQLETIAELLQERGGTPPASPPPPSPPPGDLPSMQQQHAGAQQHLEVELADGKAKIRRLRQELEEKSEQVMDGRVELESVEAELRRLQQENSSLLLDARAARCYRDELDALRERAARADRLESEVGRYRDRLHGMEVYRAKVEELKEDNQVLLETKALLEEQAAGWRARSDTLHRLEKRGLLLEAHVHDLEQEKEVQRRRMAELEEENLMLCVAQRSSMEESQLLGWELEQLSRSPDNAEGQRSLCEEVSERTSSRLLRLERENQGLLRTIEDIGQRLQHQQDAADKMAAPFDKMAAPLDKMAVPLDKMAAPFNKMAAPFDKMAAPFDKMAGPLDKMAALFDKMAAPFDKSAPSFDADPPLVGKDTGVREEAEPKERGREGDPEGVVDREEEEEEEEEDEEEEEGEELQGQEKGQLEEEGDLKDLTPDPEALDKASSPRRPPCRPLAVGSPRSAQRAERLEVRCRALDTENQRLQAALDNTGRKLQRVEAEVRELDAENQALQAAVEELRIAARRLEQLEREGRGLEQEAAALERDKRRLEKENRRLKQQAELQASSLDGASSRVVVLEREVRALGKEAEELREGAARADGLERDNRELAKQAAIDHRTLSTLREELVSEKLKSQQRENALERQAHALEMRVLNQDPPQSGENTENRFKMLESELESSLKRSLQIKEDKMAALEARLQESAALNLQLRQELKTVRLNYEALQQREEEERAAAGSGPAPQRESDQWRRESQEATRELLRVKDRLIEVERNNATLQAERQALQGQLRQLGAGSDGLQQQILALQRQTASLQESNTALQTHNANLQVEKSTLNSRGASLLAQNGELQRRRAALEGERAGAARELEGLRSAHAQLLRDQERLAALHGRQAQDGEALAGKHGALKAAHRSLELEHRTLQDRVGVLEAALRQQQDQTAQEKEQNRTSASECCRLRDENDRLNQTHRQLQEDHKELQSDHKSLKTLLNAARLDQARREADFSALREQCQQLDIASTKLTHQCELLGQLKGNLEEENRHLLDQVQSLMLQNRTLLEQTMESKDLFHVEQRQNIDRLNELRRQKEKLEEKIMDQYKFYHPSPPRRRGNWIALKMRKLIGPRSREEAGPGPEHLLGSLTPTRSGSCEGLGGPPPSPCQDAGVCLSSAPDHDTPPADDALSPRRRSGTLSDLAYPKAASSGRWRSVAERLEGEGSEGGGEADGTEVGATSSSLASSASSVIHPPTPPPPHHHHHHHTTANAPAAAESSGSTDKESSDSAVPSGPEDDEPRNHGVNGVGSRARSESSGEFSLSLDNEPWSRASSPARQPPQQPILTHPPSSSPLSSCPPPSDTSTPRQRARPAPPPPGPRRHIPEREEEKSSPPSPLDDEEEEAASGEAWPCRRSTVRRKAGRRRSSDAVVAVATRGSAAAEETPVRSPIAVLYVQGRASTSVSGCLNCFSSPLGRDERARGRGSPPGLLPRASSVISTAEGSSRRPGGAKTANGSPANGIAEVEGQNKGSANRSGSRGDTGEPVPPAKPPRDPAATAVAAATGHALTKPPLFCDESLFGTPFNFSSVFSDTVFTESVVGENGGEERNRTFLCLHPCRVRNASCPPLRHETEEPAETGQSQNGRRDGGGEEGETTGACLMTSIG